MSETKEKVRYDSDQAATYRTDVKGWVSRHGGFFGKDEQAARYDGSTHRECQCGGEVMTRYLWCPKCSEKKDLERYLAMPEKQWDYKSWVYSERIDKYFEDSGSLQEYLDEKYGKGFHDFRDCRLILCEPNIIHEINPTDYYCNLLPEDIDLPCEVEELFEELNRKLREGQYVLSYKPGKYRVKL